MISFFSSGNAVDVVILVLAIEALILARRGWRLLDIASLLLPAAFILLALRAALTGADWPFIAVPLTLSFPVHLVDVRRRAAAARSSR